MGIELKDQEKKDAKPDMVRKHFVAEVKKLDEDDFEADVVISTGSLDRDKEIVEPKGMTLAKPERIPLVAGHAYGDLTKQIGEVGAIIAGDKKITARPKWYVGDGNAQADWAWTLAKKGVAAFSVGFIPLEVEQADLSDEKVLAQVRDGKVPMRTFKKWELVEVSQVIIPSNRSAVQRMVDAGVLTKELADPIMDKANDEPMTDEAQKALDEALASYKKAAEDPAVGQDMEGKPFAGYRNFADCVRRNRDKRNPSAYCAEVQNRTEGDKGFEVDIAEMLAARPKDQLGGHDPDDVLGLFDDKTHNSPEDRIDEEGKVPPEATKPGPGPVAGAENQKPAKRDDWNLRMPDLEAALATFKSTVASDVAEKLDQMIAGKVSDAVKEAVAQHMAGQPQLPADSAAFASTKDLIGAIVTEVMAQVRREIARARGDVDLFGRS